MPSKRRDLMAILDELDAGPVIAKPSPEMEKASVELNPAGDALTPQAESLRRVAAKVKADPFGKVGNRTHREILDSISKGYAYKPKLSEGVTGAVMAPERVGAGKLLSQTASNVLAPFAKAEEMTGGYGMGHSPYGPSAIRQRLEGFNQEASAAAQPYAEAHPYRYMAGQGVAAAPMAAAMTPGAGMGAGAIGGALTGLATSEGDEAHPWMSRALPTALGAGMGAAAPAAMGLAGAGYNKFLSPIGQKLMGMGEDIAGYFHPSGLPEAPAATYPRAAEPLQLPQFASGVREGQPPTPPESFAKAGPPPNEWPINQMPANAYRPRAFDPFNEIPPAELEADVFGDYGPYGGHPIAEGGGVDVEFPQHQYPQQTPFMPEQPPPPEPTPQQRGMASLKNAYSQARGQHAEKMSGIDEIVSARVSELPEELQDQARPIIEEGLLKAHKAADPAKRNEAFAGLEANLHKLHAKAMATAKREAEMATKQGQAAAAKAAKTQVKEIETAQKAQAEAAKPKSIEKQTIEQGSTNPAEYEPGYAEPQPNRMSTAEIEAENAAGFAEGRPTRTFKAIDSKSAQAGQADLEKAFGEYADAVEGDVTPEQLNALRDRVHMAAANVGHDPDEIAGLLAEYEKRSVAGAAKGTVSKKEAKDAMLFPDDAGTPARTNDPVLSGARLWGDETVADAIPHLERHGILTKQGWTTAVRDALHRHSTGEQMTPAELYNLTRRGQQALKNMSQSKLDSIRKNDPAGYKAIIALKDKLSQQGTNPGKLPASAVVNKTIAGTEGVPVSAEPRPDIAAASEAAKMPESLTVAAMPEHKGGTVQGVPHSWVRMKFPDGSLHRALVPDSELPAGTKNIKWNDLPPTIKAAAESNFKGRVKKEPRAGRYPTRTITTGSGREVKVSLGPKWYSSEKNMRPEEELLVEELDKRGIRGWSNVMKYIQSEGVHLAEAPPLNVKPFGKKGEK